jgi:hypothetical protein
MVIEHSKVAGKSAQSSPNQTESILRSMLRLLAKAVAARLEREQADDPVQRQRPDVH